MTLNEQYLVDVIGFNPVERSMLASIFALAARRDPAFLQYDPNSTVSGTADIYLVDLENEDALAHVEQRLHRMGVVRALEAEGFAPGDDVEIAGIVFELT